MKQGESHVPVSSCSKNLIITSVSISILLPFRPRVVM